MTNRNMAHSDLKRQKVKCIEQCLYGIGNAKMVKSLTLKTGGQGVGLPLD